MTRGLSDDDRKIWTLVARTVEKLNPARRATPEPEVKKAPPPPGPGLKRRAKEAGVLAPKPEPVKAVKKQPPPQGREVDLRTQARLKRGQMDIDATLDLHGHRVQEAYFALRDFITDQFNRGARCILIIHGKGAITGEAKIKTQMPRWLEEWPDKVLQYSLAKPEHGGAGASYVLLRRRR